MKAAKAHAQQADYHQNRISAFVIYLDRLRIKVPLRDTVFFVMKGFTQKSLIGFEFEQTHQTENGKSVDESVFAAVAWFWFRRFVGIAQAYADDEFVAFAEVQFPVDLQ